MRRALVLLALATACATSPHRPTVTDEQSRTTIEQLRNAINEDPTDGARIYVFAQYLDKTGDTAEALQWLRELERLGWTHGVNDHDFVHLRDSREYRTIAARLNGREPHVVRSTTAFTIPQRDLIPEGIAYDAATGDFYVSSIHLRKIVRVTPDGQSSDFIAPAQDGIFGALGLKVDAGRQLLWVVSNANEAMSGYSKELEGHSAVHAYALRTGKVETKIFTGNAEDSSLLNDLVVLDDGSVLITDTDRGTILRVRLGSDQIEPWLPRDTFMFPNGIALAEGEPFVYVADFNGLSRVDLRSRTVTPIEAPDGETLSGIDGLTWYRGALIGIQNGVGRPRVIRVTLDDSRSEAARIEVLEAANPLFDEPTTGAVANGAFYFLANPQLRAFDEHHVIWPHDRLKDVIVLKLPLG
ncbi:MAG TPA: SMP-30/gluconolactonase/LRE family protein [Thermoanaerobaculia bacterium]|nr:SMP-30/gluconolactonase/LRE family protein [Thermoanaerobaculia bacterium]